MIKNSITQNYNNNPVEGTVNAKELTNFLCGKCMILEDTISISSVDSSSVNDGIKYNAIKLNIDPSQNITEKNLLTNWIIDLDSNYLLTEYLYNEIFTQNPHSDFHAFDLHTVSRQCKNYIKFNLLDKYKLKEILFWSDYFSLNLNTVPGSGSSAVNPLINLRQFSPVYSYLAKPNTNATLLKDNIAIDSYLNGNYKLKYKQKQSSQDYTFIYYFDAIYERI